jgi:hypothetical protein
MYIKSQTFNDEDTLMEMLFDFALGDPAPLVTELKSSIEKDLQENETYQQYRLTLEEEDRLELEAEERYIRLAEALMERFESFKTAKQKLYGIKQGQETLLYEIDME